MSAPDKFCSGEAPERSETARHALLIAARKLFAERGFDGVSVKEVAQATGHNPALINYHFNGKEGLYRECVMPFIGSGVANTQKLLRVPTCKEDFVTRFTLFMEDLVIGNVRDQDLCLILKRDSHTQIVKELYKDYFVKAFESMYVFLRAARRARIIRRDLDIEVTTHIIFGSVFDLIALDRYRKYFKEICFLDEKHQAATIRHITDFMLAAMLVRVSKRTSNRG